MEPDAELSTTQVAELLNVDRSSVSRIPADRLRFRRTPGGHRKYARSDVDRYLAGLGPDPAPPPTVAERLAVIEAQVADLQAWRDQQDITD